MTVDSARSVLVTGATGKQGNATAEHLLQRGFRVRALTRDPGQHAAERLRERGAEVVRGDFDDASSLADAMEGMDGLFLISHYWDGVDREVERGSRVAGIAAEVGIEHLVFASVANCDRDTGVPHFESKRRIEEWIETLGVPHTFLRPVAFMENWEWPDVRDAIRDGTLAWPLGPKTPYTQIAVTDVGAVAALAFEDPERWTGGAVELAGDERMMEEIADAFGRALGRDVRYEQAAWDAGGESGEENASMMRFFEGGGFEVDIEAVRRLYPELLSFDDYLERSGWTPS